MKATKSGNITIKLGPLMVQEILHRPLSKRRFESTDHTIQRLVYNATSEKFTDVKAQMDEHHKAVNIMQSVHNSEVFGKLRKGFKERESKIHERFAALHREESEVFEKMVQEALNEAGVTDYIASGWSLRKAGGEE